MSTASKLAEYQARGFTREQAQMILLMRTAAVVLFRDFPDHFVLFGGATLLFYHDSVRHSSDLDLLSKNEERPSTQELIDSLDKGLKDLADVLHIGKLTFDLEVASIPELKISVQDQSGRQLFRVDFNRYGSIIDSEIEYHPDESVAIASASRDLLLFQKAEAFLFRRAVKARDAFDIDLLFRKGAGLTEHLQQMLSDRFMDDEIESEQIEQRIAKLTPRLCEAELEPLLPRETYDLLEQNEFKPLRNALYRLYQDWL